MEKKNLEESGVVALNELLRRPGIWRGGEQARQTGLDHVATGFQALDQALPGHGWPLGALTEILHPQPGMGELRLLMPALSRLSHQGRWIAWIAPPYLPYAPALAAWGLALDRLLLVHPEASDALWAVEQALRSGTCGAVLASPTKADPKALRRLQLAAEAGQSWGVLFRPIEAAEQASPAALRLLLAARGGRTAVRLLKCRGGSPQELLLDLPRRLPAPLPKPVERRLPLRTRPAPVRRRQPVRQIGLALLPNGDLSPPRPPQS